MQYCSLTHELCVTITHGLDVCMSCVCVVVVHLGWYVMLLSKLLPPDMGLEPMTLRLL